MSNLTAFFDRRPDSIDGVFTLQHVVNGDVVKLFDKLPARSGQAGHTKMDWENALSPIPYTASYPDRHAYKLWTQSLKPGKKADFDKIGEFFYISTGAGKNIIQGPDPKQRRVAIGLHRENKWPGSAGCIVLLDNTLERDLGVTNLFNYLRNLEQPYIDLKVV